MSAGLDGFPSLLVTVYIDGIRRRHLPVSRAQQQQQHKQVADASVGKRNAPVVKSI